MIYDVVIVGAGPSGLFTGYVLEQKGINFLIIEKGNVYSNRNNSDPFDVSYGFGGAGLFSDGKLSYAPSASNLWTKLNDKKLAEAYEYIQDFFSTLGILLKDWEDSWTDAYKFEDVKEYDSMYLSDEKRRYILDEIYNKLRNNIVFNETVSYIDNSQEIYNIRCDNNNQYSAKSVVMATGKGSSLNIFAPNIDIKSAFMAEMGVRVEVDKQSFLPNKEKQIDYKIIEQIDDTTEIRTFCCCKSGRVKESLYKDHITYNGETTDENETFSNIGIVVKTKNKHSIYAKEMLNCFNNNQSKVIDVCDFLNQERVIGYDTDKLIKRLLYRVIKKGCGGKIYGPEIEKIGDYPILNSKLEVRKNLHFIGDCTGAFRGLMAAFVSGTYIGLSIADDKKKNIQENMKRLNIKQSDTQEMKMIFTAQSKAYFYCRDVICQYVLEQGFLPINPFRVFDYFLNDRVNRDLIRRGNNQLIKKCEELWVFGQIADGVLFEIASAIEQGKKVRFFTIGTRCEEIKEISLKQISFEPEVHARQIKKSDLIRFIESADLNDEEYEQMSIYDMYGDNNIT